MLCSFVGTRTGGSTTVLRTHLLKSHSDNREVSAHIQPPVTQADVAFLNHIRLKKPLNVEPQSIRYATQLDDNEFLCMLCENMFENKIISIETHLAREHKGYQDETTTELFEHQSISRNNARQMKEWKYFDTDQSNSYAKCKLCLYKVLKIHKGVIIDLRNHLSSTHPETNNT